MGGIIHHHGVIQPWIEDDNGEKSPRRQRNIRQIPLFHSIRDLFSGLICVSSRGKHLVFLSLQYYYHFYK